MLSRAENVDRLSGRAREDRARGRGMRASPRERPSWSFSQYAPFSSLQRRIIFFNLMGLALLVAGMTYLTDNRQNVIEVYVDALRKQGQIIAIGIAETAATEGERSMRIDPQRAATVLSRLAEPTSVRFRLYDDGQRLMADTYYLFPGRPINLTQEAGATASRGIFGRIEEWLRDVTGTLSSAKPYSDLPVAGISNEEEVLAAATGDIAHMVRVNRAGEAVVSVAIPIVKSEAVIGVLQLSTVGGAIDALVSDERTAVLELFFIAAIVSVLLSIVLANMIAAPIRLLAKSAHIEGEDGPRSVGPDKPEIPDLTHRSDEIGELSGSLIRMTSELYRRIDAIESFAADVAHEIKNPLTSLRSAVDTMSYAKTDEQRQRLLDVISHDVRRLDRLVTDISNASRLDAELVRERMETFDLRMLIERLAEALGSQAADQKVKIDTDLPGRLEVRGLEGRIAQVVTNLMTNALSFAPPETTIMVTGRTLPDGGARVIVEDEGPGIPPENLDSVFERFYSERPSVEAFGNHSGLGLSISRQIIEAHGGHIWAENIPHPDDPTRRLGARFVFELPERQ